MSELTPLSLDDYEAIADAVQETERGRWFLAEFARRNRSADTETVLEALAGLELRVARGQRPTVRAIRHVEEALRIVRLTRAEAPAGAADRLAELQATLDLALDALGAARTPPVEKSRDATPSREPDRPTAPLALAPPSLPDGAGVPANVERPADAVVAAPAIDAAELNVDVVEPRQAVVAAPAAVEPPAAPPEPAPEKARLIAISGEQAAPAGEPVARPATGRRAGLLESLSEAEKAVLFA